MPSLSVSIPSAIKVGSSSVFPSLSSPSSLTSIESNSSGFGFLSDDPVTLTELNTPPSFSETSLTVNVAV